MVAARTGIAPQALLGLPTPLFEAIVEESNRLQWTPLTELVAGLCEKLGMKVPRPAWNAPRGPEKIRGRAAVDYLVERGGSTGD